MSIDRRQMVTLCQMVLTLNAVGLLVLVYVCYTFRKPIAMAVTMARRMMAMQQPPPPPSTTVVATKSSQVEETLPSQLEEALPPEDVKGGKGESEGIAPRKRLTFAAED